MAIVIPYVKQSWTDGSGGGTPISAARLGVLEEGILDVSQAPAVRVTHNANQSTTTGVDFTLAFNTETYDQAGGSASTQHDNVTNNSRLTCVYAGIYAFVAQVEFTANLTGQRSVWIQYNGTTKIFGDQRDATTNVSTQMVVGGQYQLAVNDFLTVVVNQTSGGALNVLTTTGVSGPSFAMVRLA